MNGTKRTDVKIGMLVKIVTKEDQRTGELKEGIVKDILTKSTQHPHGIKVRMRRFIFIALRYRSSWLQRLVD